MIKTSRLVILFFLFAVLINCSDDEAGQETEGTNPPEETEGTNPPEETSEVIFKLNVSSDTSTTDNWIIVHNDQGELIDYLAYESGDEISIEAERALVTDNITITTFKDSSRDWGDRYFITSYTEIAKGSTWNFKPLSESPNTNELRGETTGSFDVNISNMPFSSNWFISHRYGLTSGDPESTPSKSVALYENISEYMISISENDGTSKFLFLDSPLDGTDVNLDYAEFKEFDNFLNVDIPTDNDYSSLLFGFNNDQEFFSFEGFRLNGTSQFNNSNSPIRLGYLNRFNKYRSLFSFSTDTYSYTYQKFGEKPLKIEAPENPSLSISNTSIQDFDFTTSIDFIRRTSSWVLSEGTINVDLVLTSWTVHSANANKNAIGTIPDEILSKYPKIKINELTQSVTNTSLYLSFDSYSEYIEKRFVSTQLYSPFNSTEVISLSN